MKHILILLSFFLFSCGSYKPIEIERPVYNTVEFVPITYVPNIQMHYVTPYRSYWYTPNYYMDYYYYGYNYYPYNYYYTNYYPVYIHHHHHNLGNVYNTHNGGIRYHTNGVRGRSGNTRVLTPTRTNTSPTRVTPTRTNTSPTRVTPTRTNTSPTRVTPTRTNTSPTPTRTNTSPTPTRTNTSRNDSNRRS